MGDERGQEMGEEQGEKRWVRLIPRSGGGRRGRRGEKLSNSRWGFGLRAFEQLGLRPICKGYVCVDMYFVYCTFIKINHNLHISDVTWWSGCWKTETLTKWMVQTGPNSVHPKNHSIPPPLNQHGIFYKMAGVEKKLKVWTFKGISMHFPSIPRCFGISIFFLHNDFA